MSDPARIEGEDAMVGALTKAAMESAAGRLVFERDLRHRVIRENTPSLDAADLADALLTSPDGGREMARELLADLPADRAQELGQASAEAVLAAIYDVTRYAVAAVTTLDQGVVLDPGTVAVIAASCPRWETPEPAP